MTSTTERALVAEYERARRALGEAPQPRLVWSWRAIVTMLAPAGYFFEPAPVPDTMDRDEARDYRNRLLDYLQARDDLAGYVADQGPVETGHGLYRLDGDGELTYRRADAPDLYAAAGNPSWN